MEDMTVKDNMQVKKDADEEDKEGKHNSTNIEYSLSFCTMIHVCISL